MANNQSSRLRKALVSKVSQPHELVPGASPAISITVGSRPSCMTVQLERERLVDTDFERAFTPSTAPSALLVIGKFGATIFIYPKATPSNAEKLREQIGAVTLHVGDGETIHSFLDDVETQIRKLRNDSLSSSLAQLQEGNVEVNQIVQGILKPAALDAIHEREGRDQSMRATQTYLVFVVYITRSRAGRILTEPTSILYEYRSVLVLQT
ncbi:uncharacterized protein N7500_008096 [Penicillium coprophilum]|uniref:uncharacterized protein n=1 Tax=Penicillium coprophilum TaxID=36646 RepID=UPI002385C0BA|nr:uncharacterized protein N7500_008096 [Penicillium coprophilum]KAJ5158445.1 hypothetical protein N7500_008096 [Penicillium coprophilum]